MTAKEYLSQLQKQKKSIEEQTEYIERMKDAMGLKGVAYDGIKVQSFCDPDKFGALVGKIEEAEAKLKIMTEEYLEFKFSVIEMIHSLDEKKYRDILYLVYIDGESLLNCSDIMKYSYDYTRELHGLALIAMEIKFPQQFC